MRSSKMLLRALGVEGAVVEDVRWEDTATARLCAMVPPPRFHLTRYAGVLAPNAKLRAEVVPGRRRDEASVRGEAGVQGELFGGGGAANDEEEARGSRHPWAWLLKRVFAVEVLVCVHCAGKLRIVEIATEREATKRIARNERRKRGETVEPVSALEARGPPRGPPGQLAFTFR